MPSVVEKPATVAKVEPSSALAQEHAPKTDPALHNLAQIEPKNGVALAIENLQGRGADQRLEQQLYASVWSGLAAAIIKTPSPSQSEEHRRRVEALQHALTEACETEKKKKKGFGRDTPLFRALVSVIGEKAAESVEEKIQQAQKSASSGLHASPGTVAQLAREIAAALKSNDSLLQLHIATAVAERTEQEISNAVRNVPALRGAQTAAAPAIEESPAAKEFKRNAEKDILAAISSSPDASFSVLQTPTGHTLLHNHLVSLKSPKEKAAFLTSLQELLGAERLRAVIESYDVATRSSFVCDVINTGPSQQEQRDMASWLATNELKIVTPQQLARAAQVLEGTYALTVATIKAETKADIERKLQQNSVERVEALGLIDEELKTKLKDTALPRNAANIVLGEINDRFRLGRESTYEQTTAFLRGNTADQRKVVTQEEQQRLVLLSHLEKLKALETEQQRLEKVQQEGAGGEIRNIQSHFTTVYGDVLKASGRTLSHDSSAVEAADVYLKGLATRSSSESRSDMSAGLAQEIDSVQWLVTTTRVRGLLTGPAVDGERARSLVSSFLSSSTGGRERGEGFVEKAETVLATFKIVDEYKRKATETAFKQGNPITLPAPGSQLAAALSPSAQNAQREALEALVPTVIDEKRRDAQLALVRTSESFHREMGGGAPLPADQLLDPERQRGLKIGGNHEDYFVLSEEWLGVQAIVNSSQHALSTVSGTARSVSFLSTDRPLVGASSAEKTALEVAKNLYTDDASVSVDTLTALKGVANDPKLVQALDIATQATTDPAEATRQLFARITPEQRIKVLAFAADISGSKSGPQEAWQGIQGESHEDLALRSERLHFERKVKKVEALLAEGSPEHQAEVRKAFQVRNGMSPGEALMAQRPLGALGQQFLVSLSGSSAVTENDLAPFVDAGTKIEQNLASRQAQIFGLIRADAKSSKVDFDALNKAVRSRAGEQAQWSTVLELARKNGMHAEAQEAKARLESLDREVESKTRAVLQTVKPETVRRLGLAEQVKAAQQREKQIATSQLLGPSSTHMATARQMADALHGGTSQSTLAMDVLRRGNYGTEDMTLVRTLYAEMAGQYGVGKHERRLTGDLARDLAPTTDPNHVETKRAALLAKGGASANREADTLLVKEGIKSGDSGKAVRGLAAAKASGSYDAVVAEVGTSQLPQEAKDYANAVAKKDAVTQEAHELKTGLEIGTKGAADVAAFTSQHGTRAVAAMAHIPGISGSLAALNPEFKRALELMGQPATYVEGLKAFASAGFDDPKVLTSVIESLPKEHVAQFTAFLDEQARARLGDDAILPNNGSAFMQYYNSKGGVALVDGKLLENSLQLAAAGERLRGEDRAKTESIRNNIAEQIARVTELEQRRSMAYEANRNFTAEVQAKLAESENAIKTQWWPDKRHYTNIELNKFMIADQHRLANGMGQGLRDIGVTKRAIAVVGVIMVDDVLQKRDRGLRSEHADQHIANLRERDLKVEWKAFDEGRAKAWSAAVNSNDKAIESRDWWFNIGHTATKSVVVLGVSIFFTPAAGFVVATAWNATDKALRYGRGAIDARTAMWQFGTEGAFDAVFYAVSVFKTGEVVASLNSQISGKVLEGSKKIWKFDWFGKLGAPLKVTTNASEVVGHVGEGAIKEVLKDAAVRKGAIKEATEAAFGQASKEAEQLLALKEFARSKIPEALNAGREKLAQKLIETANREIKDISSWFHLKVVEGWSGGLQGGAHVEWNTDKPKEAVVPKKAVNEDDKDPLGQGTPKGIRPKEGEVQDLIQLAQVYIEKAQADGQAALASQLEKIKADLMLLGADIAGQFKLALQQLHSEAERIQAEKDAADKKAALEKQAQEKADAEAKAAELAKLQAEKEALQKAEQERLAKEAAEKEAKERAEKEAAERARKESESETESPIGDVQRWLTESLYAGLFERLNTNGIFVTRAGDRVPVTPPPPTGPVTPSQGTPPRTPPIKPSDGDRPGATLSPLVDEAMNTYVLAVQRERAEKALQREESLSKQEQARAREQVLEIATAHMIEQAHVQAHAHARATAEASAEQQAHTEGLAHAQSQLQPHVQLVGLRQQSAPELAEVLESVSVANAEASRHVIISQESTTAVHQAASSMTVTAVLQEPIRLTSSLGETNLIQSTTTQLATATNLQQEAGSQASTATSSVASLEAHVAVEPSAVGSSARRATQAVEEAIEVERERSVAKVADPRREGMMVQPEEVPARGAEQLASSESLPQAQAEALAARTHASGETAHSAAPVAGARHDQAAEKQVALESGAPKLSNDAAPRPFVAQPESLTHRAATEIEEESPKEEQSDDSSQATARKRKTAQGKARLRALLIQQLLTTQFTQSEREKRLRLLISLGVSESEYRQLVAKLGEAAVQATAQLLEGRKIAVAREVSQPKPQREAPALKESRSAPPVRMKDPAAARPHAARVSRAELYVRMKE